MTPTDHYHLNLLLFSVEELKKRCSYWKNLLNFFIPCLNLSKLSFQFVDNKAEKTYIMMEARLGALFKTEEEYTILDKYVKNKQSYTAYKYA